MCAIKVKHNECPHEASAIDRLYVTSLPPCWRNNRYDQKNEPTIFLPSGVHTMPKPKPKPKFKPKTKSKFRVRVSFLVSFRFCLSGVLRWAKIALAHLAGRTRCPPAWRMITKVILQLSLLLVPPTWPPCLCDLNLQGLIASHGLSATFASLSKIIQPSPANFLPRNSLNFSTVEN